MVMDFLNVAGKALDVAGAAKSLFSGSGNSDAIEAAERAAYQNYLWQKEFAQSGIKWRVDDARSAGLHPLFALGGTGASFQPSAIAIDGSGSGESLGARLQNMGQALHRAAAATSTAEERHLARMRVLAEDRAELENTLLRAQIAVQGQLNPPLPNPARGPSAMPGQESGLGRAGIHEEVLPSYKVEPSEIPTVQPGLPSQQGGAWPGVRWERTPTGWRPHHSKELIEDSDVTNLPYLEWAFHNRLLPSLPWLGERFMQPPPDSFLPDDAVGWVWHDTRQEYQPAYKEPGFMGPNFVPRRKRR